MLVNVTVSRSADWVKARRLETGENVPTEITVPVEAKELSPESRRILLEYGHGNYPDAFRGSFGQDYTFNSWSNYGRCLPLVDADNPTTEQIDAGIREAARQVAEKAAKAARERKEREEREEQQRREREEREAAIIQASELLAAELHQREQWHKDRATLAEFLAAIPMDAKRGALKALAHGPDAVEALQKRVEDASPIWIFEDDDEEEDEDD